MDQHRNDYKLDDASLNKDFARKMKAVLADLRSNGEEWYLVEARRTSARQRMLYAQGRPDSQLLVDGYSLSQIKLARADGGLSTDPVVTWTLKSKHLLGIAADVVPIKGDTLNWKASKTQWARVGSACKAHGLTWGGSWKKADKPHCQLDVV